MTTETERAAAAIRDNPNGLDPVHAPEVDYTFEFERHQLIAMAACVAIFVGTFLAIYLKTGSL